MWHARQCHKQIMYVLIVRLLISLCAYFPVSKYFLAGSSAGELFSATFLCASRIALFSGRWDADKTISQGFNSCTFRSFFLDSIDETTCTKFWKLKRIRRREFTISVKAGRMCLAVIVDLCERKAFSFSSLCSRMQSVHNLNGPDLCSHLRLIKSACSVDRRKNR